MNQYVKDFTIRPFGPEDINGHLAAVAASRPQLAAALSWASPAYGPNESAAWVMSRTAAWAQASEYSFVVEHAPTRTFAGSCSINRIDWPHQVGNLTYWIDSRWTGRGAATAGAMLAARFAFANLGLRRVEILAAEDNAASIRVAEKLGAVREGVLRQRLRLGGARKDAVLLSILPRELNEPAVERRPMGTA
ncbi:GNAT family protein [Azospirillum sp.]|uniref:GNAT family N-acetyltransferase n=1 Tax=Azospirillum sp. TaxID=34012 RepID=UPI002D6D430B|nr:GNAT family protein [Azospirillum sp.]HYD68826.1 GNAT family protein [Azospirillum sp.]